MVDQNEIAKVLKHRTGLGMAPTTQLRVHKYQRCVFHETQTKYFSSNVMYNVSTTT